MRTKILLVDDDVALRSVVAELVESEYELSDAENGEQAWFILTQFSEDYVLVTDYQMPIMDGRELLQRVLACGKQPLGIGFMSGHAEARKMIAPLEDEFRSKGVDFRFFEKPFSTDGFQSFLKKIIAEAPASE